MEGAAWIGTVAMHTRGTLAALAVALSPAAALAKCGSERAGTRMLTQALRAGASRRSGARSLVDAALSRGRIKVGPARWTSGLPLAYGSSSNRLSGKRKHEEPML